MPNQARKYVQTAHQCAGSLLGIINDILDVSRAEVGELPVEWVPFSLEQALVESLALFATRAEQKGIRLTAHVSGGLVSDRLGDPLRVRQIVTNLVGNALKFTSDGHVDVLISTDPGDPELVTIAVTDSGIGIAPADLLRVFEPFAQADERVTRRAAGTGLGLTISRNLARRLGGDIDVRSELGQGSTFTARLRLPPLGTTPVPQARSTSPALVLGSDSAFSASFVALAPCIGRRAEGFTNPDALLSRAESSVGSPILIDARLPLDAVIATAKRLRTRGHEGPVWRVGYLGIGPAVSWSDAGFDGSVPLPVFPETLVRLFERPLESAAATSIAAQPREVASDRIEPASESPDTPRVRSCRPSRR